MAHPSRPIPILGTQKPDRIARAAEAYQIRWTRPDWYCLLTLSLGRELP
jgi:predicted oxidoreductase